MKSFKFSDIAEFIISLAFTGAVIFGLTYWAENYYSKPPVSYAKDATIDLLPIDATIEGNIELFPTAVEDQKEDFTYKHGQAIFKEQQGRKAGSWTNTDSSLAWTFAINSPQKYKVSMTYASEGGKIEASLNNKALADTLENTDGLNSFKDLDLGEVELPAGTHTLTIKGTELVGEELLRLESITLEP